METIHLIFLEIQIYVNQIINYIILNNFGKLILLYNNKKSYFFSVSIC